MDKWIYPCLAIGIFLIAGCVNHEKLAERYKLDLQYYEQAIKLAEIGMGKEAENSCEQAVILKNECYISIIQRALIGNVSLNKEWCSRIDPEYGVAMTKEAYYLVYPEMDKNLLADAKEKMNPSKRRINNIQTIKDECEKR